MLNEEVRAAIEAILFSRSEPVTSSDLARVLELPEEEVLLFLREMEIEYNQARYGIRLVAGEEGYSLCTKKEYARLINALNQQPSRKLSTAALETLAVIAYRQPVTRAEIELIRGVKVEKSLATLLEKGLICEVGRKDGPGRPVLYGTSGEFLRLFGLTSLKELPPLDIKGDAHGREAAGGTD